MVSAYVTKFTFKLLGKVRVLAGADVERFVP